MSRRIDELLSAFLQNDLTPEEQEELDLLVASNENARERHREALENREAFERGELHGNVEEPKTTWRVRLAAILLLLLIVFGFASMFFIEFQDPYLRAESGTMLIDGHTRRQLRQPGQSAVVGVNGATLRVRGNAFLIAQAGCAFSVRDVRDAAGVTILGGSATLEVYSDSRRCHFNSGNLLFENFSARVTLEFLPQSRSRLVRGGLNLAAGEGSASVLELPFGEERVELTLERGSIQIFPTDDQSETRRIEALSDVTLALNGRPTTLKAGDERVISAKGLEPLNLAQRPPAG